ncbi:unnamed protein product, partial [Cuscuta epithymum]
MWDWFDPQMWLEDHFTHISDSLKKINKLGEENEDLVEKLKSLKKSFTHIAQERHTMEAFVKSSLYSRQIIRALTLDM